MNIAISIILCLLLFPATLLPGEPTAVVEKKQEIVVALLQMSPQGNDLAANKKKAEEFCHRAAKMGADIALMPEMWSIGYTRFDPINPNARGEFYALARSKDSAYVNDFAKLAAKLDIAVGVTYLEKVENSLPRNTITLFDRKGKEVYSYSKIHTSDFNPMEASMAAGTEWYVGNLDTRVGTVRVGSMICYDREFPESARILMLKGAELILTPNACKLDSNRIDQFKVRAFENVLAVAMANYPGDNYLGHSVAFSASGKNLIESGPEEGIFLARIDLKDVRDRRAKSIWGNAYRKPQRYQILLSTEKEPVWNRIDGNGNPWKAGDR